MNIKGVKNESFELIERSLAGAAIDLFEAYGIKVERCTRPDISPSVADASVVAIIGFAGERLRGSLVLTTSAAAVHAWHAALGVGDGAADVCDTLGEFSNMLLGRLKGRLLLEGFPILISTPATAFGRQLVVARSDAGISKWLAFDAPTWRLDVRVGATFDEGFERRARDESSEAPALAGDCLMF